MKKYYQIHKQEKVADIDIYGDIVPYGDDSTVDAKSIKQQIKELDVDRINVNINSCGGDVFEALAIYNSLIKHKAKIHTYCDGLCASAASIIYCAGDERIMSDIGMLMIHNAWTMAMGNAKDFRKQADDLEKITQQSIIAYLKVSNLTEEKIKQMMDDETWLDSKECLEYGFATKIEESKQVSKTQQMLLSGFNFKAKQEAIEEKQMDQETKDLINSLISKLDEVLKSDEEVENKEEPIEDEETEDEEVIEELSEEETDEDKEIDEDTTSDSDEDEKEESPKESWNQWFKR